MNPVLTAWLFILGAPVLNVPVTLAFFGFKDVRSGKYRERDVGFARIGGHELLLAGPPLGAVLWFARSQQDWFLWVCFILMAVGGAAVAARKFYAGQLHLASNERHFREQPLGLIYDLACVAAMIRFGFATESPLWFLGALLRVHYNVWNWYHLYFLNAPPWSYGYLTLSLLVVAILIFPLSIGDFSVDSMQWLFSTIAQVFAAVLGVVGMFAIHVLGSIDKPASTAKLTGTTSIQNGVTGFIIVNLIVIGLSGLALLLTSGGGHPAYLSHATLLGQRWGHFANIPARGMYSASLVVLNVALVGNALGYVGVFLALLYAKSAGQKQGG